MPGAPFHKEKKHPRPVNSSSRAPTVPGHYLSPAFQDEELTDLLLLADIVLLQKFLVQPVGVLDAWYWVLHLHRGARITRPTG